MYENLQVFFESTKGKVLTTIVILIIFALIIFSDRTKKNRQNSTKVLTISALMIALAMVLGQIKLFSMPQGGAVTLFSMLPIAICAYVLGPKQGILAGICVGLLNLIFGPYVIHPLQLIIDYPLAFGAMGIGGVLRKKKYGLVGGYLLGVLGRYVCAFLSGLIFFGSYAPEGFNAFTWSLWYNFTYLGAEAAITSAIILIPQVRHSFERLKTI
jgi:thiamine transporter